MSTRSLLPYIVNDEAVSSLDWAMRELLDGTTHVREPYRASMTIDGVPATLDGDEIIIERVNRLFEHFLGLNTDARTHETDADGLYAGPLSTVADYALMMGNQLWTENWVEVMGERYVRRAMGDRMVTGAGRTRYAPLLNENAGQNGALNLIGELINGNVSATTGVFNPGPVSGETDKSKWVLTHPTNTHPRSIDILIARDEGLFNEAQLEYLNTVIPRYLDYRLVDVRISVISTSAFNEYYGVHIWQDAEYIGP